MAKRKKKNTAENIVIRSFKEAVQWFFICIIIGIIGLYIYRSQQIKKVETFTINTDQLPAVVLKTEKNYGKQIDSLATVFDVSSSYLKALICLECSGRKTFTPRFEKRVFESLKEVRDGVYDHFGTIKTAQLSDASDAAIKNLASSWGPFQLMGYQCIELGVNVKDIRGDKSLYWGTYWVNRRYGKYIRQNKFKDAFHIHNTGKPYPILGKPYTYDPNYIKNGLMYMSCFNLLKAAK